MCYYIFSMKKHKYLSGILIIILLCVLIPEGVRAGSNSLVVPEGFYSIVSETGVNLYRKDYPGGNPDFVQMVNLYQGAKIKLLHGDVYDVRNGHGAFGGFDARISTKTLKQYWNDLLSDAKQPFCVLNGQFFKMGESPTRLPFSLKVDGKIITDGYGKDEHTGDKLMLEIWSDHVEIRELSKDALYNSTAPNIIAGLTEEARKSPTKYVARTFIGIDDQDGDRRSETILIFNTKTARQKDAAQVLREFGADKVMMLDGGGSTQLLCQDEFFIQSDRLIPQAIGVIPGSGSPIVEENAFTFNFGEYKSDSSNGTEQLSIVISDTKFVLFAVLPVALILIISISRIQRKVYY